MIKGVLNAIIAYFTAFGLISRLRLWRYFIIPGLISVVLAILIFGAAWIWSDELGIWMTNWYPWEKGKHFTTQVARVLSGLMIVAFGLIIYKNLVMALASPFMSLLSEQIEKKSGRRQEKPMTIKRMLGEMIRGIRIALRNIFREIVITIAILLLGLIPVFSPFAPILIFIAQSYYAGFGSMDFTLERYFGIKESIQFVHRHRGMAIGNGAVFILLLMTGLGFLIALPWSTVASTTEVLTALEHSETS